jgi:hypothetical protein
MQAAAKRLRWQKPAPAHVVETIEAYIQPVQHQLTTSGSAEAGTKVRLYNEASDKITCLACYRADAHPVYTLIIGRDDKVIKAAVSRTTATHRQTSTHNVIVSRPMAAAG